MPHYATRAMSASDITRQRLALSPLGKSGKAKSVELLNPSGWQFAIQVPWRAHGGSLILCSPAQVLVCALVWCLAETAALARLGPRVTYSFKIKDLVLCLKWQLMTILQFLETEMRRQIGGKWMSTASKYRTAQAILQSISETWCRLQRHLCTDQSLRAWSAPPLVAACRGEKKRLWLARSARRPVVSTTTLAWIANGCVQKVMLLGYFNKELSYVSFSVRSYRKLA